ncbi:MAG: response regulator [Chloroflexi bacterium]|nr:response regulator [Chloroflexota bacterium]
MLDRATFSQYVRDALARLDDRPHLRRHALTELLAPPGQPGSPEALRRAIVEAIEELRPPEPILPRSPGWRRYRLLRRRYVEGVAPDQIARELMLSERQCRREHGPAVEAVAAALWERCLEQGRIGEKTVASAPALAEAVPDTPRARDPLEEELARAVAKQPKEPTQPEEVLASVLRTVASLSTSRGADVQVHIVGPLALVAVQRVVLRQILLGLLGYALGLAGEAPVEVTAANAAQAVELVVRACRPGSGRSQASFRSRQLAAVAELSAARRLAELQGAALYVETPDDASITFHLALPGARAVTVLVVDDNPDVVRLFQRYLAGTSYRLVQACTGQEALLQARKAHPEAIVLDVLLPSEDGWEVLEALRGDPATRDIPVVVCSVVPDQLLALSLGVVDFLSKPVTRPALLAALARCRETAHSADNREHPLRNP